MWPKMVATLLTEKEDPNAEVRDMSMREGRGGEAVLSLCSAPLVALVQEYICKRLGYSLRVDLN